MTTVFISYSHDSPSHRERVLALSDRLSNDGIKCLLDQYEMAPSEGWPRWMSRSLDESDHVIVVCSERYCQLAQGGGDRSLGKGVRFESLLSLQDLYDSGSATAKYAPVVFSHDDAAHIPKPLRPYTSYNLADADGYDQLYRRLTGQPLIVRPAEAPMKTLPVAVNLRPTDAVAAPGRDSSVVPAVDASDCARVEVELRVKGSLDHFSESERTRLLEAIRQLLNVDYKITITKVKAGSVIVTLNIRPIDAAKLLILARRGDLKPHQVEDVLLASGKGLSLPDAVATLMNQVDIPHTPGVRETGHVVLIDRHESYGIIEGDGGGFYVFDLDKTSARLRPGDRVETSKVRTPLPPIT